MQRNENAKLKPVYYLMFYANCYLFFLEKTY